MRGIIVLILVILTVKTGLGQNVFQSNLYMFFQPNINFASASSYDGINVAGFYRNQWVNYKGAPNVYGVNAFFTNQEQNSTIGISLFQDNIGIHEDSEINLNYSYRLKLGKKTQLSFSLSPSVRQLKDDFSTLTPTQENDVLLTSSSTVARVAPNAKFGTYLFRDNFYIGFSTPNLLINNMVDLAKVTTSFNPSQINYYLHSGLRKSINSSSSINGSVFVKTTSGSFIHTEVNLLYNFISEKLGVGLGYKTSKELAAILNLRPNNRFSIGYAYQYTLTELNKYISGGHELILIYTAYKPERVKITPPRF